MGPAILLCPSSSAVNLWGQVSPLKKTRQKDGGFSLSHCYFRCSANAHCTGDLRRRQPFFLQPALSCEKIRELNYPFAWRSIFAAASGGELSVEDAAIVSGEAPAEQSESSESSASSKEEDSSASEAPTPAVKQGTPTASEGAPATAQRRSQGRRTFNRSNSNANKSVIVSPAELLPGAVFPGKVTSIQSFGAFVDLGAFTNGLVHISRLSKSYVKKVEDVVQVGQDVKVQVLEVDLTANRISLMLIEEAKEEVPQGEAVEKQPPRSSLPQQAKTPRKESSKRLPRQTVTTMKKGEIAPGIVKNIIKSAVFVTLPDGTDGYLPASEVIFKGLNTNLEAQFQVGQDLTVRVLRIEKGRVNLTMKREVNFDKLNEDLNKGVTDGATNPFEIAFRRNELIASFLLDRDKQKAQAETKEEAKKEEFVSSQAEAKDEAKKIEVISSVKGEAVSSVEQAQDVAEVDKKQKSQAEAKEEAKKEEAVSSAEDLTEVENKQKEQTKAKEEAKKEEAVGLQAKEEAKKDEAEHKKEDPVTSTEEAEDVADVEDKQKEQTEAKEEAKKEEAVSSQEKPKEEVRKEEAVSSQTEPTEEVKKERAVKTAEVVEDVAEVENKQKEEAEAKEEGKKDDAVNSVEQEAATSVKESEEVALVLNKQKEEVEANEEAKKEEAVSSQTEATEEEKKEELVSSVEDVAEAQAEAKEETKEEEAVSSVEEMAKVEKLIIEKEEEKVSQMCINNA